MKKTYVKPVMNSELFVTNEYIAACWTVTCNGYNPEDGPAIKEKYKHTHTGLVVTGLQTRPTTGSMKTYNWYDAAEVISRDTVRTYDGHWDVTVTNRATNAHPNASN